MQALILNNAYIGLHIIISAFHINLTAFVSFSRRLRQLHTTPKLEMIAFATAGHALDRARRGLMPIFAIPISFRLYVNTTMPRKISE